MPKVKITRKKFLEDSQGRTFSDVFNESDAPFEAVLRFFDSPDRQRRMEESELHHDRSPLAGVVRELEALPEVDQFLSGVHIQRSMRFRQAIGVLVRIIMEAHGWEKTGRKGSLGVRSPRKTRTPRHNTGGLAFWFNRGERYRKTDGMPFLSVKERCEQFENCVDSQNMSMET